MGFWGLSKRGGKTSFPKLGGEMAKGGKTFFRGDFLQILLNFTHEFLFLFLEIWKKRNHIVNHVVSTLANHHNYLSINIKSCAVNKNIILLLLVTFLTDLLVGITQVSAFRFSWGLTLTCHYSGPRLSKGGFLETILRGGKWQRGETAFLGGSLN